MVRRLNLLNIFASFCCLLKTETKWAGSFLLKLTPLRKSEVIRSIKRGRWVSDVETNKTSWSNSLMDGIMMRAHNNDQNGEAWTFSPKISLLNLLQVLTLVQSELDHILKELAVLLLRGEPHPFQHLQSLVHLEGEAGVEEEDEWSSHLGDFLFKAKLTYDSFHSSVSPVQSAIPVCKCQ